MREARYEVLTFTIYGVAQPKGSMTAFTPRGMKFPIITDSNRNAKAWAQLVAHGASDALGPDGAILDGPVRLTVAFYLPRPQKFCTPKWRRVAPVHLTAPDLDKLLRSVGDALTGVVYRDDAQVVELVAIKRYTAPDAPPHATIRVDATAGAGAMAVPAAPLPLFTDLPPQEDSCA
jgi:Holliday junction resolvase RusA-like endonuclease